MSRLTILAATLAALTLFSCKRSESGNIGEVAQEDIDFATQATGEVVQASAQTSQDPGSPPGVTRYGSYRSGYFIYSYSDAINLRGKCVSLSGSDTTDVDNDLIRKNAVFNFNCSSNGQPIVDTITKASDTLIVKYILLGNLYHYDGSYADIPGLADSVVWNGGSSNSRFQAMINVTRKSDGTVLYNHNSYQKGKLSIIRVPNTDTFKLLRYIEYNKDNSNCRYIALTETVNVFLDQVHQGWHPGDTLYLNDTLKTWPIGHGTLNTCSGVNVSISSVPPVYPTDMHKIIRTQNGVCIKSGKLKITLTLPTGTQEIIKDLSNCPQ